MAPLAPSRIGFGHTARLGGTERGHFEAETIEQLPHLRTDAAPLRHDERFGHRPRRKQKPLLGFKSLDAPGASSSPSSTAMSAEVSTTIM